MRRRLQRRYGHTRALPPGPYVTRGVLAGAYAGKNPPLKYMLTHTVSAAGGTGDDEPLCTRVRAESMCDMDMVEPSGKPTPPTCPVCLKRDPRFKTG